MGFDPQQIIIGLANGSVYAALGLALVVVFRTNGVINFAQGEMSTFTAYLAWTFVAVVHMPYFLGALCALACALLVGAVIEVLVIRHVRGTEFTQIIATLGLFIFFNGLDLSVWGGVPKSLGNPFGKGSLDLGGIHIGVQYVAITLISLAFAGAVFAFFRWTSIGRALEASTFNATAAKLVGINVPRMLTLGWALSAVVGGVASIMSANLLLLTPEMMSTAMIFSFAAISLGGVNSPLGAVVGGLVVGVLQSILGTYIPGGTALRTPLAFLILLAILIARPQGLFGRKSVVRA